MLKIELRNVANTAVGEYIGRKSCLGNPYHIGRDGNRKEVIRKYRSWLWKQITNENERVVSELVRLIGLARRAEGVVLLCHCSPKACHGDVVIACMEWAYSQAVWKAVKGAQIAGSKGE